MITTEITSVKFWQPYTCLQCYAGDKLVLTIPRIMNGNTNPDYNTAMDELGRWHKTQDNYLTTYTRPIINLPEQISGTTRLMDIGSRKPLNNGWFNADVAPKHSIRIWGLFTNTTDPNGQAFDLTFNVGDTCVVDQYNMIYTGTITKITANSVFILNNEKQTKRLQLSEFIYWNWNYDAARIAAHNKAESECI